MRGGPFHFVTSNALCWVALDRAIKLGEMYMPDDPDIPRWRAEAETIKDDVLEKGWSKEKKAFVQHYDSDAMDAATLLLPLLGFIDFNDPRFISTLERIEAELRDGPFVSRFTGRMRRMTACSARRARSPCAASGLSRCLHT